MTKKDYIKFADLLIRLYKDTTDEKEQNMLEMVRVGISEIFSEDNERFNAIRFNEYITDKTQ